MGIYFSCLHIKRTADTESRAGSFLMEYFSEKGYTLADPDTADFKVSLRAPADSRWISVLSDSFTHTDVLDLAPRLSGACDTEILNAACFDSDYLFLNLLDTSKELDLWLNIGDSVEIKKLRRSNVTAWKGHVADHTKFKEASKKTYAFAEDFLREVQDSLGISCEQCMGTVSPVADEITLYFSAPQKAAQTPTRLENHTSQLNPCKPGISSAFTVLNKGDSSRGICILIVGDYIEHDEIIFDEPQFIQGAKRGLPMICTPINFEKCQWPNGQWVLYWEDPDFCIPPSVSPDLPPRAYVEKEFERSFGVRFVPNGNNRKFLDITVYFAPLSNFENGQCSWRVWQHHKSKRDYIKAWNRSQEESLAYGIPEDVIAETMLDESEYDLD